MKRIFMMFFVLMLLSPVTACANNNTDGAKKDNATNETAKDNKKEVKGSSTEAEKTNDKAENKPKLNQEDLDYMKEKMDALPFTDIDVEVKYAEDKEYEFKIEQDPNEPIEAEVENELSNEHLKGREAFDVIYPKIEGLDITSSSTDQDIIEKILTAFDLPTDYVKIEVEIKFNDGKEIDFEHRK